MPYLNTTCQINPLNKCCFHTETSQLICCANQLTGFYMRAILALNGLNPVTVSENKSDTVIQ